MPRFTKSSLEKHLRQLEKEELVEDILKLFARFKPVQDYYRMELSEDTREVVDEYKKKLRRFYFTNKGFRRKPQISGAKALLLDFRKASVFPFDLIDLMLLRVELGVEYINSRGYATETFYKSTQSAFSEALQLIQTNHLSSQFKDRCEKIVWFVGHSSRPDFHQHMENLLNEWS
jgi:hypothetical protein